MAEYRNGGHAIYDIKYHFVWITKYRYKVLRGQVAVRARWKTLQSWKSSYFSRAFS